MTRFTSLVRLLLLKLAVHKKRPSLTDAPDSIATPLGHVPGDYRLTITRLVNLDASLDEGVQRARNRCYVPEVDE